MDDQKKILIVDDVEAKQICTQKYNFRDGAFACTCRK